MSSGEGIVWKATPRWLVWPDSSYGVWGTVAERRRPTLMNGTDETCKNCYAIKNTKANRIQEERKRLQ